MPSQKLGVSRVTGQQNGLTVCGEFSDNLFYIERSLFTEIAARTWDREMYYRMMTPHDETVQRALQYFKDGE